MEERSWSLTPSRFLLVLACFFVMFQGDSFALELVGSYGGGVPKDVVVQGDYAYVATEGGLLIVDVSDPSNPRRVANHVTEEGAFVVALRGDFAYLCSDRLRIIDVSRPEAPVEVGLVWAGDMTYDVAISGDYAYLACFVGGPAIPGVIHWGIEVVDISDPASPSEVALIETGREPSGVAVADGRAYIAIYDVGLKIMDLSDPSEPLELGSYDGAAHAQGVAVEGDYAYVADGNAGLKILDVSDPGAPVEVGRCEGIGSASRVRLSGRYAYVWAFYNSPGFKIVDISDPENPYEAGGVDTWTESVFVSDGLAYTGHELLGLQIFDIDDPADPVEVGEYRTSGHPVAFKVHGDRGYLLDAYFDMTVLDMSDPRSPSRLGACQTHSYASDLYVSGDFVYVTQRHNGLSIVDATDSGNPVVVGYLPIQESAIAVWVSGDYAFVTTVKNKLKVIDVSDPTLPVEAAEWTADGGVSDIAIHENRAYLTAGNHLYILDIRDPLDPYTLASTSTRSAAVAVWAGEHYAYVAEDLYGVNIYDVSGVYYPLKLSSIRPRRGADDVWGSDTYAYVASDYGGISVIDVSDPEAPLEADSRRTPGYSRKIFVDGSHAYLVADGAGLLVFGCERSRYRISGYVREASGSPVAGIRVRLSGDSRAVSVTTSTGYFALSDLEQGDYAVTLSAPGWRFTPEVRYFDGLDSDMADQDFVAGLTGFVRILGGRGGHIEPGMGEAARLQIVSDTSGTVTVGIYTLAGRLVWKKNTGISRGVSSEVVWDCVNRDGSRVASGVYLVRVTGCGMEEVGKVVVLR